jgi:polysaccharide export outer membrane protein
LRGRRAPILALFLLLSAAAPAQEPPPTVAEYVIGVADRLKVSVWREDEVSLEVSVRPDGKITVPLVGDVQAAGRTASEIARQLTTALAKYIKEPVVTVIVTEVNSFKVYVIGEVNRQGELLLRKQTRLLQALAMAGGLTQFADKDNIVLVREEGGRESRRRIEYRNLVREEGSADNVHLKPGDTIIVN